jgi:hypothetical protein
MTEKAATRRDARNCMRKAPGEKVPICSDFRSGRKV